MKEKLLPKPDEEIYTYMKQKKTKKRQQKPQKNIAQNKSEKRKSIKCKGHEGIN